MAARRRGPGFFSGVVAGLVASALALAALSLGAPLAPERVEITTAAPPAELEVEASTPNPAVEPRDAPSPGSAASEPSAPAPAEKDAGAEAAAPAPAWRRNAAADPAEPGVPLLALVLTGLATPGADERGVFELSAPLTIGLDGAEALAGPVAARARRQGWEVLAVARITGAATAAQAVSGRVADAVAATPEAAGVMIAADGSASLDVETARRVLEEAAESGLMALDPSPRGDSHLVELARAERMPAAQAAARVEADGSAQDLVDALARAEAQAQLDGAAVAVVEATPDLVRALERWLSLLDGSPVHLAPLSAAIARAGPTRY